MSKHGNREGDDSGNPPTAYFYKHGDEDKLENDLLEEQIATFYYVYSSKHHKDEVSYDWLDNNFSIGSTFMGFGITNLTPVLKNRVRTLILQYFGSYGKVGSNNHCIYSNGSRYDELQDAV